MVFQIELLGQPQLRADGTPHAFRAPARALSLLTYLLLHRAQPSPRDAVAFLFWPDLPESEARAKLRYDIRELREALPQGEGVTWILADNRTIRWNPEAPIWLDVAEFERLASVADGAAEAVALYGGDLAHRLDDEWLQAPRERLRELQSSLLFGLVESSRAQGDVRRAMSYAQRLVQHDPWREDAVRALIELRHESRDRAGALRLYSDFAERLQAELGAEPMYETTAVYQRVLAAAEAAFGPRHNLPVTLNTFVGRQREAEALRALLETRRLVTLIGAGGVGKTRLATEVARTLVDCFSDGVWLVELAPIADPTLIASTIAGALGLLSIPEPSLLATLQGKHLLLVLDNCEHLIADAARIVERFAAECPRMHVLATSREPLRIAGERLERVVSLELPATDGNTAPSIATLRESPAVQLFLDRAADAAPAFKIDAESVADRSALAAISFRLDGIPLAIELAAARTSSHGIEMLAQRLDDRFAVLTAGRRTALPRQQTLQATLDWSYGLLAAIEQRLFDRLGVFAGGWTLDAAMAVCSDDVVSPSRVIDVLSSLVDKSLVVVESRGHEARYHLLETTRAYALQRLAQGGEGGRTAQRHAEFYLAFAEQTDNTWGAIGSYGELEHVGLELDNFRAALHWAIDGLNDPALGSLLLGSLRWFFGARSLNAECVRWSELALVALGPKPEAAHEASAQLALAGSMGAMPFFPRLHYYRAAHPGQFIVAAERAAELLDGVAGAQANRALALSLAAMHLRLANEERAASVAGSALSAARDSSTPLAIAMAVYATSFTIDPRAANQRTALLTEALELARTVSNLYYSAVILHALAEVAFESGDSATARLYAQESTALQAHIAPLNVAQSQINRAAYCLRLGLIDEARTSSRYALSVARRIGEPMIAAAAFQHVAAIAADCQDTERAARLLGASNAQRVDAPPRLYTEQTSYDLTMAAVRKKLSDSDVDRLLRQGQGWSIDYAMEQAGQVLQPLQSCHSAHEASLW